MKVEGLIFAIVGAFFALVAVAYGVLANEWVGTAALTLSAAFAALLAFYLLFTGRRIDLRPEDNPDADVSDGAGELGFFSPHSWWPLPLAASAALIALGVVFGWWLVFMGAGLMGIALYGLVFEYYRGHEA